jgi:hypothetical protein
MEGRLGDLPFFVCFSGASSPIVEGFSRLRRFRALELSLKPIAIF